MAMNAPRKHKVTYYLPVSLLARLRKACKQEDRTPSAIVVRALEAYLSENKP